MSHPKIQHYVPRFLLAAFETSVDSGTVYAYDKRRERSFAPNVRNVAAENAFYDVALEGLTLTFEQSLAELESRAARVFARIVELGEVGFLKGQDRVDIASFVVAQGMRTRHFFETVHASGIALAAALDERHPGTAESLGLTADREQSRLIALDLLGRRTDFVPLILQKVWALYEAPEDHPFWIGDHPVAMANDFLKSDVRGTLGLAVPGIEIYLPLTPRYCLGFLCPTLKDMAAEAHRRSLRAKETLGIETARHDRLGALRDGLEYGWSIPLRPDNVEYVNSLQVLYSERFIFSKEADFTMVEEMIAENPNVKIGPRVKVR